MKNRFGIVLLMVALVTLFLATLPTAAPALTLNSYEKQVISQINKQRVKRGLPKVSVHAKLVNAARAHSTEMATQKYFRHSSLNGETFSKRIIRHGYKRTGYSYWKVGENIAWGSGLYSSPTVVVQAWMKSKAHRNVILTKRFRNIGVGAVKCEDGFGEVEGVVWFFTLDMGRRIR
jgi:uncharacterized protein YkwD